MALYMAPSILYSHKFQPNTYSPANVDASVAFRNWKEGKDNKYKEIISKQVCSNLSEFLKKNVFFQIADSQEEALRDGVRIPMTQSEYCIRSKQDSSNHDIDFDMDDDDDLDDDEYDEEYSSSGICPNLLTLSSYWIFRQTDIPIS